MAGLAFVLRCITFASAIPLMFPLIYTICNAHLVPQCALSYEGLDVLCDVTHDQKARGDACHHSDNSELGLCQHLGST